MTTVHVLGNPAAGAGRGDLATAKVLAAVRATGATAEAVRAEDRDAARAALARLAHDGATRVVLVGGDGLAHLAVQELAGSAATLGLVPVGTGNDFARALGLAIDDVDAAVRDALAPPVPLDLLRTTHGWVASVATMGFAAAVNARANALRRPRGQSRYTVATLLELPRLRPLPVRLELDGVVHEHEVALLAIANTAYFGGGMVICPDASPSDGLLDVAVVGAVGRFTLLRFFPQVFRGRHVTHPAVTMLRGRRLRVEAEGGVMLWGDGELVGPAPLDVEVVTGALRVAGARAIQEVAR